MQNFKVLLADDSITIQKLVNVSLAGRVSELIFASDAQDAHLKAKRLRPDLVLVDSELQGGTAQAFCEGLKKERSELKIIVLQPSTAMTAEPMSYADASLVKPFNSEKVLGVIEELLGQPLQAGEEEEEKTELRGQVSTPPPSPSGPFSSFRAAEEVATGGAHSLSDKQDLVDSQPQATDASQGEDPEPSSTSSSANHVFQKLAAIASEVIPHRSDSVEEPSEVPVQEAGPTPFGEDEVTQKVQPQNFEQPVEPSFEPAPVSQSVSSPVESSPQEPTDSTDSVEPSNESASEEVPSFSKEELVEMARFEIQHWVEREMPRIAERVVKQALSEATKD